VTGRTMDNSKEMLKEVPESKLKAIKRRMGKNKKLQIDNQRGKK
jgi:hypothetical protein